ncbi:Deleted in malignant brain tumors 1 protein [Aphelenchoides fujianensis]|nr:Deleted in malignant brain tumors 1 protein [Aphelenchoides fujianensis]
MRRAAVRLLSSDFLLLLLLFGFVDASAIRDRCKCGRRTIEMSEETDKVSLFSPEFPRPYCSSLNCLWILRSSNGTLLHFSANKIDLRSRRDFIEFFDGEPALNEEPALNCTGRRKDCAFTSSGNVLAIRFRTGRGVPDRYGFKGEVSLLDDEFQAITDDEGKAPETLTSAWNFIVWVLLLFCVFVFICAVVYLMCLRKRTEETRSPLLRKSSQPEDPTAHLPIDSTAVQVEEEEES